MLPQIAIQLLQKYLTVDIYGKCGRLTCTREDESVCHKMLEHNYKFYLSFENSICDDYVTEKLFKVLRYDVIPIYYGGADLTAMGLPPKVAIDVLSFESVKALVKHLEELARDDAKFAEHFWWRDYYEIRDRWEDRVQPFCDLCKALHNPKEPRKVYADMHKWFVTDSNCRKMPSSFFREI